MIQTVALRHETENKYSMSYYYKVKQPLSLALTPYLMSEDGVTACTELNVEIFATLNFDDTRHKEAVKFIKGEWFDLNGNLIRLFSLISEFKDHKDDEKTFRRKLSDAIINRDNFAALMGDITFSR
jgi:hypothetical protein